MIHKKAKPIIDSAETVIVSAARRQITSNQLSFDMEAECLIQLLFQTFNLC